MIKTLVGILGIFIIYLIYGFLVSTYIMDQRVQTFQSHHPYPFFDYKGATNVSTIRSLGSGEDQQIIDEAKASGLDFLFMTDLNLLDQGSLFEGYANDLLVLRAGKYSYLDSRLMYYRPEGPISVGSLAEVQVHLTDILSQSPETQGDSFVVLTHPFLNRYSWTGEWPIGLNAFEVVNFKRLQQERAAESRLSTLWSLLIYPFNPELAFVRLIDEPREELKLWDEMSKQRKIVGHLGLDATAKVIPFTGSVAKFPSYETLFRLGSEHVLLYSELTGNLRSDKIKILKALRQGTFYFSLDVLGDPKGFNILLEDSDQPYLMGSALPWKNHLKFRMELPPVQGDAEIQVYRDGELIATLPPEAKSLPVDKKGVYRFIVRTKVTFPLPEKTRWVPWIFTNTFRVE